jgi:hypothetical protein
MAKQEKASKRDQSLSKDSIDENYLVDLAQKTWTNYDLIRSENSQMAAAVDASWRDLRAYESTSPWDWGSDFHVPLTLSYGKTVHARLWQLFSNPNGFYSVESLKEVHQDREVPIKRFMDWVLYKYANNKLGARREFDRWLWDVALTGSGYLKVYWKKDQREYRDVVVKPEIKETLVFDPETATGRVVEEATFKEKEEDVVEDIETPQIRRILAEDIAIPVGYNDPQDCPHVVVRCYMNGDQMKDLARQGKFYKEAVEFSLDFVSNRYLQEYNSAEIKADRQDAAGYNPDYSNSTDHIILEYYGPAYIGKDVLDELNELDHDVSKSKREIVAWIHKDSGRVLGWTYLSRISPSGLRPLFKADYMTFPERTDGVGVAELLYDIQRNTDALHNLRMDNGMLASIPMFAYRSSSNSLKPQVMKVRPGEGIPLDDVNDVKPFSFPFLTGFGSQEQAQLDSYAQKLIATGDLQMGLAPAKVGALRNATGSNLLASESGIQLEIHFDRLADCMSKMLKCLFELCRERMPEELFFRVMGERGEPIFGRVNRNDLRGQYDFIISADILGQSQLEKQQMSVMVMQTLQTPTYLQTGIVSPENLYNMAMNFLKVHKIGRIDDFLTPPQGYAGPRLNTQERLARIMVGQGKDIAETVRLDENHQKALQELEDFADTDYLGVLQTEEQLAQFKSLMDAHEQMSMAQQQSQSVNYSGSQLPQAGEMTAENVGGMAPDMMGVPNGPVV